jgi:hypothetical protein
VVCPVLPEGDLRETVLRHGPTNSLSPPTSGNAWSRRFLEEVLPVPEGDYRIGADTYLFELAPIFGSVRRLARPHGCYRLHGRNNYARMAFDEKLAHELVFYDRYCDALAAYCERAGLEARPDVWRRNSWWHRLAETVRELDRLVPAGTAFALADQGEWGIEATDARRPVPFVEHDGQYWGPPADDDAAIRELERLRAAGARFVAFGWPAFWWLDHYSGLREHLRSRYRCVLENDRLVVFAIGE